jgi:hypothetical protein
MAEYPTSMTRSGTMVRRSLLLAPTPRLLLDGGWGWEGGRNPAADVVGPPTPPGRAAREVGVPGWRIFWQCVLTTIVVFRRFLSSRAPPRTAPPPALSFSGTDPTEVRWATSRVSWMSAMCHSFCAIRIRRPFYCFLSLTLHPCTDEKNERERNVQNELKPGGFFRAGKTVCHSPAARPPCASHPYLFG